MTVINCSRAALASWACATNSASVLTGMSSAFKLLVEALEISWASSASIKIGECELWGLVDFQGNL